MSKVSTGVVGNGRDIVDRACCRPRQSGVHVLHKPNLIMVGGHEDNTPVISVVLDYITLDLTLNQACHGLTWGMATEQGTDENRSRETICFNIDAQADDERKEIEASFLNIPDNGKLAGMTKSVATISAREDRTTAIELAEQCRMRAQRPKEGAAG